jgi:hypothetical protein
VRKNGGDGCDGDCESGATYETAAKAGTAFVAAAAAIAGG